MWILLENVIEVAHPRGPDHAGKGLSPILAPTLHSPGLVCLLARRYHRSMSWCDELLGFCDASGGAVEPPPSFEDVDARIDVLPMTDWVRGWRVVCTTGLRAETPGIHAFKMFFDRLSHDAPEHGMAFIEAVLQQEPDDEVVMQLAEEKVLGQLLVFHARMATPRLQEIALRQPRLRWLMGRKAASIRGGMVEEPDLQRRLLVIADEATYRAWSEKTYATAARTDFASLSLAKLAEAWVEINSRSDVDRQRDEDWYDLFDFQGELAADNPLEALELVKAILGIEDNPNLLGSLSAGLLDDLIPVEDGPVVDAIVAEAARNPRFMRLLGGVWFSSVSDEVAQRLETVRGEVRS